MYYIIVTIIVGHKLESQEVWENNIFHTLKYS